MSKVPCGGFKLDENFLGMNENDELSLTGGGEGKAFKQLVTDGDGGVKWEDRLAYDDSKVVVDVRDNFRFVRVSDEVPSFVSGGTSVNVWISNGTSQAASVVEHGNGNFSVDEFVFILSSDNVVVNGSIVFPKKGVYFLQWSDGYIAGIASVDSDTPEITWDGNIGTLKTIDPKYIPSELNEIILPSSTSGSSKKFKITVNDNGAITATEVTT